MHVSSDNKSPFPANQKAASVEINKRLGGGRRWEDIIIIAGEAEPMRAWRKGDQREQNKREYAKNAGHRVAFPGAASAPLAVSARRKEIPSWFSMKSLGESKGEGQSSDIPVVAFNNPAGINGFIARINGFPIGNYRFPTGNYGNTARIIENPSVIYNNLAGIIINPGEIIESDDEDFMLLRRQSDHLGQ